MKVLKIVLLITGILFALSIALLVWNIMVARTYEMTNQVMSDLITFIPPLVWTVFFIILCVTIIKTKGNWTKWIAFVFAVLFTLIGGLYIYGTIMNRTIVYKDTKILYIAADDPAKKIIEQSRPSKGGGERLRTIIVLKQPTFFMRKITHMGYGNDLNGKWLGTDPEGNPVYVILFENGKELWRDHNIDRGLEDAMVVTDRETLNTLMQDDFSNQTIRIRGYIELDKPWIFKDMKKIVIQGLDQATLLVRNNSEPVIRFEGCEEIIFEGLTLLHIPGFKSKAPVIEIIKSKNIDIQACTIRGPARIGILIREGCDAVNILNNVIHDNTQAGIESYSPGLIIEGNTFYHNGALADSDIIISPQLSDRCEVSANTHAVVNVDDAIMEIEQDIVGNQFYVVDYNTEHLYENPSYFTFYYNDMYEVVYIHAQFPDSTEKLYIFGDGKKYYSTVYSYEGEHIENDYYFYENALVLWEERSDKGTTRSTQSSNTEMLIQREEAMIHEIDSLMILAAENVPYDYPDIGYDGEYPDGDYPGYYEEGPYGDYPDGTYPGEYDGP